MTLEEVKNTIKTGKDYKEHIWNYGYTPILVAVSGSWAYGTNKPDSDIDARGIFLDPTESVLGLSNFEQHEVHDTDKELDIVMYGLRKFVKLALENNPNVIELLTPQERNIIYASGIGKELIENRHMFLSKRSAMTFGGYAKAQLDRIENAMARDRYDQEMVERHMLHSILGMIESMNTRYKELPEGGLELEIIDSDKPELNKEIVVNCNLHHYPLRDFKGIWSDMQNVVKDYGKLDNRNRKKDDNHMNKHAMHLVRLLLTGIDILEKEEILPYREDDLDLLNFIRNGGYMDEEGRFVDGFYDLVNMLYKRFEEAKSKTKLPEKPNYHAIENWVVTTYQMRLREGMLEVM